MALRKTVTTNYGVEVQDAYIRVVNIRFLSKTNMAFTSECYNVTPSDNPASFAPKAHTCAYNMGSQLNPFQQAYIFLKTLPEWSGATDVLED